MFFNLLQRTAQTALVFLLSFLFCSSAMAADCTSFTKDVQDGRAGSKRLYKQEPSGLYLPSFYCPFGVLTPVQSEAMRTELLYVEQCERTGYKILKTHLVCLAGRKKPTIESACTVDGMLLAPCLSTDVALQMPPE